MNEVNPEKTYALVVGVEKYQETAPDLYGPARDAVQFTSWLLNRDVNPSNIGLFISPLEEGKIIQEFGEEEKFNQIPRNPATFENIRRFIYHQLHNKSQDGELLYVFWSGHGFATPSQEQTERRLLFSDFSNIDPRNLNLNSLVNALKFPEKKKGFEQQIYLIDACAHIRDSKQYQTSELKFTSLGAAPRKQYILFAVTEGATAINKKSEGGSFSKAIFEELKDQPLLPDMDHVATEVDKKLKSYVMKPIFWKQDWSGNYEINSGNLFSDSDTPTPEEQKNAVLDFLKKVEEKFQDIKLFHVEQKIPLTQQYIPIQVTLERRYKKLTEDIGSYAESEAEMKQIYALKGINEEEFKKQQVNWEDREKNDELKKYKKFMVLADPGMGKSTLLRMEALRIAKDQREKLETGKITVEEVVLPLFLRLSELASEVNKPEFEFLPEAIADVIKQIYSDRTEFEKIQPLIVEKIKKGECFLLIDAWDEVEQDYRTKLKSKLDNFKQIDCPMIATSRIVGYTGSPIGGAKEVEIVPFDQQQTENYIKTWFENAKGYLEDESVSAESLIKELQNRPQINGLVKNPLLLSLVCSLYQTKELELPAKRSEIYKQAVDCMLQQWRNQRQEQKTVDIDFKKEVLESFAYQISREGKEVFNLRELRKKIRSFLQQEGYSHVDSMAIITELSEEDGIIQQIDKDGEKYIFLHRTFQEYFTASYLNESKDRISLAQQFFWNYDQHETLTLLAGLMDDPTSLVEEIYTREDDIFKTQLLLAGRCLAECSDQALEASLTTDIIESIHQFWLSYPHASFINSTVVALARVNSEAVEALIAALNDSDSSVRRSAAQDLGKIGNAEAVQPLIAALDDSDFVVRSSAASALGKIGNPEAVEALMEALNYSNSDVRWFAAETLGKTGNAEVVKHLISALDDSDSYVRRSAATALGHIGNPEALKPLIAALNDSDSEVRSSAAKALGHIGNPEAVEGLIAAFNDSNFAVSVVRALGRIGNPEALNPLIAALNDSDSYVRKRAVRALAKIGSAAWALGQMGNAEVLNPLIAALHDSDKYVRSSAATALGYIGNPEAVEGLIDALNDSDFVVRKSAAKALGRIGNAEALNPLIAALNDSDRWVRWSAAEALGNIGNAEAVKPLIAALNDSDSDVRRYAAEALGKIGTAEVLKQLLQDPTVNIYESELFYVARRIAIRYSQKNYEFIPVYPKYVKSVN
ncbi:MAG: HEAT repeat domain-containing protein [Limnoraphis sp.]